jgi:hypothetical protein
MANLRALLRDLFPEFDDSRITITETDEYYQINTLACEEQKLHPQKYSPRITIYKRGDMYIRRLTSCKPVSGAEIVRRYIRLARELGLRSVYLDDGSEIYFPSSRYGDDRCAVDLAILRILQKGESWYESLGFVSRMSKKEREHNEQIRQMPFGEFIQRLIEKEHQEAKNRIIRRYELNNNTSRRNKELANIEEKKSELEEALAIFPEIDETTPVYKAIQKMVDRINTTDNACESIPFRILQLVIKICSTTNDPIIHYEYDNLTMTL